VEDSVSEPRLSILLATVDPSLAWLVQQAIDRLSGVDIVLLQADSLDSAERRTKEGGIHAVVLEHALLDGDPVAALIRLRAAAADLPLLIAGGDEEPLLEGWLRNDCRADQLTADELGPRSMSRFLAAASRPRSTDTTVPESPTVSFDGIVQLDGETIAGANEIFARLVGCTAAELAGRTLDTFLAPDSRAAIDAMRMGEGGTSLEVTLQRADGSRFPAEVLAGTADHSPRTLAVRDLSTRRLWETSLHELRERYRSLLSQFPAATWEADLSGVARFIEERRREGVSDLPAWFEGHPEAVTLCAAEACWLAANEEAVSFLGAASVHELVSSPGTFGALGDGPTFATAVSRLAGGETSFDIESTQRIGTGEMIPVRLRVGVAPGYHGSLARIFVSIVDRRPDLQREESVREAEARAAEAAAAAAEAASRTAGAESRAAELGEQLRRTEEELHRAQMRLHETRQEADRAAQQLEEVEQALEISAQRLEEAERHAERRLLDATSQVTRLTATYQALVRSVPIPVIVCSAEGTVDAWNAAAEKLFGWSAEAVIGTFNPTIQAGERERYLQALQLRIAAGETREIESLARVTSTGTALDLKLSCVPLVGPEGEALGEVSSVLAARPARPVSVTA